MPRALRLSVLVACAVLVAGCATGPDPRDPWEPMNRHVADFNESVDSLVLKPAATVYRESVPPLVRTGVANFFANLTDAWSAVNSLLQLKPGNAGENWLRFTFNTAFGLLGVLDIASEMGVERHREDFGTTLAYWGTPSGPYLVLPLLGPSTLRDALAMPADWRHDPLHRLSTEHEAGFYGLRAVHVRSTLLRASNVLDEVALDKYRFTRDAYLQRRQAEIDRRHENRDENDDAGREPDLTQPLAPSSMPALGPVRIR